MRLDKFLKVSRVIKRRSIAKSVSDLGFIKINEKIAKPSNEVKINDLIELNLGERQLIIRVKSLTIIPGKQNAQEMFEIISDKVINNPPLS